MLKTFITKIFKTKTAFLSLFVVATHIMSASVFAELDTANIYTNVEKSVYQIRVLNKETGKKSSIGSGFVVTKNGINNSNS